MKKLQMGVSAIHFAQTTFPDFVDLFLQILDIYSATTRTGGLKSRLSNHNVFWTKKKRNSFLCKRTNNIHDSTSRWKL